MKKITFILIALLALFFASCQKEDLTGGISREADAQEMSVSSPIENSFEIGGQSIERPEDLLKRKRIKIEELLPEVLTFIKVQYAGSTPVNASVDGQGNIYVVIKNAEGVVKVLSFTKNGTFIKETTVSQGGGSDDSPIKIIRTYIEDEYPGSRVGRTWKDREGNINVTVRTADGKTVVLKFDSKGKFIEAVIHTKGETGDTLANIAIKKYLNEKYPGSTVVSTEKTREGGYRITLKTADGKAVVLIFDRRGRYIKSTR